MRSPYLKSAGFFALLLLLFSIGCGGSGSSSASKPQNASTPAFSSAAPTAASEGKTYSYAIQVGTGVTLALTTAPAGAVLSGNTLTWTPTRAQSRTANNFTVTATTAAGTSSQSQSWTVTPAGTIYGSCIDTFWVSTGSYTLPYDLSPSNTIETTFSAAALVPQADGSIVTIPGTGFSNGTFTVPNVPAGYYWLQVIGYDMNVAQLVLGNFWTSSSTFDWGSDGVGRQPTRSSFLGTLNWDLTNLTPWSANDTVALCSPNEGGGCGGAAGLPIANGGTTLVLSEQMPGPMDQFPGDLAYVTQETTSTVSNAIVGNVLSTAALPSTFRLVNPGDIANATAAMVPVSSSQSMEMNVNFPAYTQAESSASPSFTPNSFLGYVELLPFVTDRSFQSLVGGPELIWFESNSSKPFSVSVQDYGPGNFGTQFPSTWPAVYSFEEGGIAPVGASGHIYTSIGHQGTTMPTAAQPDKPVMTAIQNPTVNGTSFYSPASNYSGPLTLSWNTPSGLTPIGYEVELYTIDPTRGTAVAHIYFYSTQTSITFPSQSLPSGTYVFKVEAVADSLANFESAPFHYGLTRAWADAVSAPITYTGAVSISPFIPVQTIGVLGKGELSLQQRLASKRHLSATAK
jgi:hypothetical protein